MNFGKYREVICLKCGHEVSEMLPKRGSSSCPRCGYGWGWRRAVLKEEGEGLDGIDVVFGVLGLVVLIVLGVLALFGK